MVKKQLSIIITAIMPPEVRGKTQINRTKNDNLT